ncbi:MAG: hypothetical protein R3325_05375 [Thermoanaerobaculia bacterium]|nr:hypothetical protein [Thermoanaerobaculia bacterium]
MTPAARPEAAAPDFERARRAVSGLRAEVREECEPYREHLWTGRRPGVPTLQIDDFSALPFLDGVSGVEHYQHRARLRAGDDDLFAAVVPPVDGYEAYCQDSLGLGRPECLVAEPTAGPLAVAAAVQAGPTGERIAAAARRAGGLDVHPFLGSETIWTLAGWLARRAGVEVRVLAPPPPVTWRANDKQSFSEIVRRVVGEEWLVEGEAHRDPAEMAAALRSLAARHPVVALKRLRCASGLGNATFDAGRLRGAAAARREVDAFLRRTGWDGREEVQAVAWESAEHSPSTQVWVPPDGAGDPRLDGIYEQLLEGERRVFAGSRPSTLPDRVNRWLGRGALEVAAALQSLGYVGRCSFDHLLVGDPEGDCELRFVECNGRWGGTSLPMHLLDRVLDGGPRPPYRAQDFVHPGLVGVPFREILERVGEAGWTRERREGRYLFYNVGPLAEHGKLDVLALGADAADADRALTVDLPRRLGL